MNFNSYIVSETKTAFSIPLSEVLVSKKTFKQKAFTLAETLITLSIIGVVASMTIPTLMANMQKQGFVSGLKKAYSQLQNAMKMMPINEGCNQGDLDCAGYYEFNDIRTSVGCLDIDNQQFDHDCDKKRVYLLSKQFKTQKLCYSSSDNDDNCPNNYEYNQIYGGGDGQRGIPYFVTEDGMQYFTYWASIGVDVNGFKGPNKIGQDQFVFVVPTGQKSGAYSDKTAGSVIPYGTSSGNGDTYWQGIDCKNGYGLDRAYCTARVLKTGKIDY